MTCKQCQGTQWRIAGMVTNPLLNKRYLECKGCGQLLETRETAVRWIEKPLTNSTFSLHSPANKQEST